MKLTDLPAAAATTTDAMVPAAEAQSDAAESPVEPEPMTEPDAEPIATDEDGEAE